MLALNSDGWMTARGGGGDMIRRLRSDNYRGRAGAAVRLIVIHAISLPAGVFGGDDIARLFCNRLDCDRDASYESLRGITVSAHFVIYRGGAITQFVSCADAAFHAGESSWRGAQNCNDFSVGIELEGADRIAYADAQYDKLVDLLRVLLRAYPRAKVAGHQHIAPVRKTDPGDAFDWARIFGAVGERYDGRAMS